MLLTTEETLKQYFAMSDEEQRKLISDGQRKEQQENTAIGMVALMAAPFALLLVASK